MSQSNGNITVIHVISGLSSGGAENMLFKLVSQLEKMGFKNHIISLKDEGDFYLKYKELGIPVLSCNIYSTKTLCSGLAKLFVNMKRIDPDIVQTWLYHGDLFGGVIAKLLGIKNIVWNIRLSKAAPESVKFHTKMVMRLNALLSNYIPSLIVCNSHNGIETHKSIGYVKSKMAYIPNGFDLKYYNKNLENYKSVREELGLDSNALLIGLIARYHPQKNHKGFFEAANIVNDFFPDAHYVLVGTGIDSKNNKIINLINGYHFKKNIHLLGKRLDIARLTSALDVSVCCSWTEGFPNIIGEAMSCAVPCVATDVGDCAEIIGDTGHVVPAGDMVELAYKIIKLLKLSSEEKCKMGMQARLRILENYSIKSVVDSYKILYSELSRIDN